MSKIPQWCVVYCSYTAVYWNALHNIHNKLYTIHYTIYTIHYTIYTIHYTLNNLHYTIYTIQALHYTIHYTLYRWRRSWWLPPIMMIPGLQKQKLQPTQRDCTVYIIQCTMYSLQCTVYSVQCTVHNVQCTCAVQFGIVTHTTVDYKVKQQCSSASIFGKFF